MVEPKLPQAAPQPQPTPREQLLIEVSLLRRRLREASRVYVKRIDTALTQLQEAARGDHESAMTQSVARELLDKARGLSLNPARGRRKDLRIIERFVKKASKVIAKP